MNLRSLTPEYAVFVINLRGGEWIVRAADALVGVYTKDDFLAKAVSKRTDSLQILDSLIWNEQEFKRIDLPARISSLRFMGMLSLFQLCGSCKVVLNNRIVQSRLFTAIDVQFVKECKIAFSSINSYLVKINQKHIRF